MKRKIFIVAVIALFLSYVISYIFIRANYTMTSRRDGATYVYFPTEPVYEIYSPLMLIDQKITGAEFVLSHFL